MNTDMGSEIQKTETIQEQIITGNYNEDEWIRDEMYNQGNHIIEL